MIVTLISWLPAFDDGESWKVVSRKQKKSPFFNCRKQSFCGEPRGSERSLFQVCCPGPGSVSKESDSGPSFSFSGGIPGSFSESQLDFIHDPAVTAFDQSLQVRARRGVVSGVPPPWRHFGPGTVAQSCRVPSRCCLSVEGRMRPAGVLLCENESHDHGDSSFYCGLDYGMQSAGRGGSLSAEETVSLQRSSVRAPEFGWNGSRQSAGVGISVFEGMESVPMDGIVAVRSTLGARRDSGGGRTAHATAGVSVGIIGSSRDFVTCASSFNSSCGSSRACMSYLDAVLAAPARAPAASAAARRSAPSSSAVGLCMHAHGSLVHDACSNSWSDTVRKGPTGRRCTKGGVSGPAEDLRPVSEVEAGVNFRPAGGVRGQVAGSLPRRQPGAGTRQVRGGVVTPSLHPEVPGIQFVSPGDGLDIRQSMGWTKVCSTARSGIWVLKGNARARMLPENLDHLRVRWIPRGTYETAWVTPGHDCLCSYQYGHGAAVRPQTNDAIWRGVIGLWGRVAHLLSPWCGRRELPTGVNLNRYSSPSSCIRWHSDNEPLFDPQNSPKLIVSMSLSNSVEFKVRRGRGSVPSLITLDHGDVLVMDGSAQSEYLHCTASGLQGPRVNLTFRWVAQHIASCPLAGVVGCVLPSCVQGLAEPGPRGEGGWGNKWSSFWGLVSLLLILVSVLLVGTLINIRRGHRYSGQRPSCSVVHFPSRGRARWVGGRRWSLSRRRQTSKSVSFYFPFVSFWEIMLYSFFRSIILGIFVLLGMLVAKWVPTPCYIDAYSVGTPKWAFWEKGWQRYHETTFSPLFGCFFLVSKRTFFLGGSMLDASYWSG